MERIPLLQLLLFSTLAPFSVIAQELGEGFTLSEKITHEYARTEAGRDLVIEVYDGTPNQDKPDAPLHKLVISSESQPEKKSLLLAFERGAQPIASPDGNWIVVNDRPYRGHCNPRLFQRGDNGQYAEDQSKKIHEGAVLYFAEQEKLSPELFEELKGDCYVEAIRWDHAADSLLVRLSKTNSSGNVFIYDWLCIYDLETGQFSQDLAQLNAGSHELRKDREPDAGGGAEAGADSFSEWFPYRKGDFWLYEGSVTYQDPAVEEDAVIRKVKWRTRVEDVLVTPNYRVALVAGMPHHAAFFSEESLPGYDLVVIDATDQVFEINNPGARQIFWELAATRPEKLPETLVSPENLALKAGMKEGDALGGFETGPDVRPGWHNTGVDAVEPEASSVPVALQARATAGQYRLGFRTSSGHSEKIFVPGVGYSESLYQHHGSPGHYEFKLVEIGADLSGNSPAGVAEIGAPTFETGKPQPTTVFVKEFLSLSSSNGKLDQLGALFQDEADYFRSKKKRAEILEEEQTYHTQWPLRKMVLDGEFEATNSPNSQVKFTYAVEVQLASLERKERRTSRSRFEMVVTPDSSGAWKIASLKSLGRAPADAYEAVMGERVGLVKKDSTIESLTSAVGKKNIKTETVMNELEGIEETISTLYGGTEEEMHVYWEHDRPVRVLIYTENSPWHSPAGIRLGTSLSEIQILNDGPFALYGFEWDYGGSMGTWLGGNLARDHAVGHLFNASFRYPESPDQKDFEKVIGDVLIPSNNPAMRAIRPYVGGIEFLFPADPWHIGGLRRNMNPYEIEQLLSESPEKGEDELWGVDGWYHQGWGYPKRGVFLGMFSEEKDGPKETEGITITAPCPLVTERGIGIGSSYDEVALAYADLYAPEDSDPGTFFVAGSIFDGLMFSFENGNVVEIFLGAAAE